MHDRLAATARAIDAHARAMRVAQHADRIRRIQSLLPAGTRLVTHPALAALPREIVARLMTSPGPREFASAALTGSPAIKRLAAAYPTVPHD